MIAAAFVGPGTVTTVTVAGAEFGFGLLWALVFSVLATIVLQEMSARLGLATGRGLGEAVRETVRRPVLRVLIAGLIVAAVGVDNAAFQTGNLTGAALGLEALAGGTPRIWRMRRSESAAGGGQKVRHLDLEKFPPQRRVPPTSVIGLWNGPLCRGSSYGPWIPAEVRDDF